MTEPRPSLRTLLERSPLRAGARRWVPGWLGSYFQTLFAPGISGPRRLMHGLRGALVAAAGGGLMLFLYALVLIPFTPDVGIASKLRQERPSVLLAADGAVIATFRRTNREWVELDRVPAHVLDALVATEDHRFWQHGGIDLRRSFAAVGYTLAGDRQGGSTLTQQLARNLFPDDIGRAPTVTRKLKEVITAIKLERAYSKREILEIYLNTVPFLYNAFGIEMAARTYFGKAARDLSLLEGATLVGMLKGTSAYNPVLNPERALARRNVVLAQMVKHGRLKQKTYDSLQRRPLRLNFRRQDNDLGAAPHFTEAVRRWLVDWAGAPGYDLYADGLVVRSALDLRLQRMGTVALQRQLEALQAVADVEWGMSRETLLSSSTEPYRQARRRVEPFRHFMATRGALVDSFIRESPEYTSLVADGRSAAEALTELRADAAFMKALRKRKTRLEAGFVALDPRNGQVRAWVGSRDYPTDRFDHVVQARRQPGSTFKPFVYGAALEHGISPWREFEDRPIAIRLPEGGVWRPQDMGGASGRSLSLEEGLVQSRNTITAQLVQEVGAAKVAKFAQRMGVRESQLDPVPSLALGTSPVTLLEMVGAYATIAALGEYQAPVLVTSISDRNGKVLAQFGDARERVLERDVAVDLVDMLRGVVDRGTGRGLRSRYGIDADVGGKTGTTQNNTDGWFIAIHPQLVAGAWVGFNDPRVSLRSDYWGQGAHNALHVVGDFMRQSLAMQVIDPAVAFPKPERGVVAALNRAGQQVQDWLGFGKSSKAEPPEASEETEDQLERIVRKLHREYLERL